MENLKKDDVKQEVFDLYDDYAHSRINRRQFVEKLGTYAVGGITVAALMSFLMPDYKGGIQVQEGDKRITEEMISYPSPKGCGTMKGLLCTPVKKRKKMGCVVVVHENRGLNPHIKDVARRIAVAGFIALAPDALTPFGGYPGNDDEGRSLQSKRDKNEILEDFIAAFDYLSLYQKGNGKVGVVGFCFGGWVANMMAVRIPNLRASVPYYGTQPPIDDVPNIQSPLMLHYAGLDTRVNEGWPAYEAALKNNQKKYIAYIYENVNHGFNNDTTPRYDKTAATLAWSRTIDFFKKNLH